MLAITLVGSDSPGGLNAAARVAEAVASLTGPVKRTDTLGPGALDLIVEADELGPVRLAARDALGDAPIDLCVQPALHRRKRLLIADMDSTIIGCECLDELADFAGKKAEVAAITERAMRGEIDF